jgi:hypothetical protein
MVEPVGTALATSNASSARRAVPSLVSPVKKYWPAPLLSVPDSEYIVLSRLASSVTVLAAAANGQARHTAKTSTASDKRICSMLSKSKAFANQKPTPM